MMTHQNIWRALETVAARCGLSPSGLARQAGLDPTVFNRSKRWSAEGRERWPGTESIARVLEVSGATLGDFAGLVEDGQWPARRSVPVIGLAQAGTDGYFDDAGFPTGGGWEVIALPQLRDPHAYALEIVGDSMLPLYRPGDIVVVSPDAAVRPGDRVVARTTDGEVMAKILSRQDLADVELASLNPAFPPRTLPRDQLLWIARIVWATQ